MSSPSEITCTTPRRSPPFLGPLARAFYFLRSNEFSKEEREKRKQLFGSTKDGLRALKPYLWDPPALRGGNGDRGAPLLEIPVTTLPILRVPIHMSYVLYLAVYSLPLARAYLKTALAMVKRTGHQLSFLLHPLDFLGKGMADELQFFPGMQATTDFKLRLFDEVMGMIEDELPAGHDGRPRSGPFGQRSSENHVATFAFVNTSRATGSRANMKNVPISIATVLGTRPEAVKLLPVIRKLSEDPPVLRSSWPSPGSTGRWYSRNPQSLRRQARRRPRDHAARTNSERHRLPRDAQARIGSSPRGRPTW